MLNYFLIIFRQYILIVLTTILFFLTSIVCAFAQDNFFFVKNIKISKNIDKNFSRNKVIDDVFKMAFKQILNKILISKDFESVQNIKIKKIKKLIESFKVMDESFDNETYKATFEVYFNEENLSVFLGKQNLLFCNPKEISVFFLPIFFDRDKIRIFNDNVFYNHWSQNDMEHGLIKFVLPIEDIDIVSQIQKHKNNIEKLDVKKIATKYNKNNYAVVVMELTNGTLKTFLKLNLNNNKIYKNMLHKINDTSIDKEIASIANEIQINIEDFWKKENVINFESLLTLHLNFYNRNLRSLTELEKTINQIQIIDSYSIEIFDINKTLIKLDYYGNPKQLYREFDKWNYKLANDQGEWLLEKND